MTDEWFDVRYGHYHIWYTKYIILKTFHMGKQENRRLNRLDSSYVFLPFPLYVLIQYSLIILLISAILIPWYRIMALEYTSR